MFRAKGSPRFSPITELNFIGHLAIFLRYLYTCRPPRAVSRSSQLLVPIENMLDQETPPPHGGTENSTATFEQLQTFQETDNYPEGGWKAWSVVFGAWCAMIPSMGLLNSLGILHAWTSTHQLKEYSESSIGWIFGAYGFFLYFAGAQAGK